jgi:hypothetical protein
MFLDNLLYVQSKTKKTENIFNLNIHIYCFSFLSYLFGVQSDFQIEIFYETSFLQLIEFLILGIYRKIHYEKIGSNHSMI